MRTENKILKFHMEEEEEMKAENVLKFVNFSSYFSAQFCDK